MRKNKSKTSNSEYNQIDRATLKEAAKKIAKKIDEEILNEFRKYHYVNF